MALARDGRALFSTSKDTTFKVSATLDGSLRRNMSCNLALSCCALSLDEKYVFIGSWDNCVYMYSVDVGRVIDQITAHDDGLSAICVVEDRIVTSSWDSSIKIWHYTSSGIAIAPIASFMDCEESVVSLTTSADGSVAAAGTRNGVYGLPLSALALMLIPCLFRRRCLRFRFAHVRIDSQALSQPNSQRRDLWADILRRSRLHCVCHVGERALAV